MLLAITCLKIVSWSLYVAWNDHCKKQHFVKTDTLLCLLWYQITLLPKNTPLVLWSSHKMTLSVIQKSHFEKSEKEKNRKIKFILIISEELSQKRKLFK